MGCNVCVCIWVSKEKLVNCILNGNDNHHDLNPGSLLKWSVPKPLHQDPIKKYLKKLEKLTQLGKNSILKFSFSVSLFAEGNFNNFNRLLANCSSWLFVESIYPWQVLTIILTRSSVCSLEMLLKITNLFLP